MLHRLHTFLARPPLRRRLLVVGLALLATWLMFFDSHSVLNRLQLASERATLRQDITELRETTEVLERQLGTGLTDEIVERVAREQYGMRRPGETVYPVEVLDD